MLLILLLYQFITINNLDFFFLTEGIRRSVMELELERTRRKDSK